ncbi:MAG: esterase, partial [Gammaproteobacteria bacterium]
TPQALGEFVESRASYVAQTALYGYMKTRAGTRFPALFEDAAMLESINIAKWRIWLACLSDLAVYCGVLLRLRTRAPAARIRAMLARVADEAVARAGAPADAGADFSAAVREMHARISCADFDALGDDDSAFTESPEALVYWAPIADELKARDAEIIRNSVRFRWQEIRRGLRKRLRAEEVAAGM